MIGVPYLYGFGRCPAPPDWNFIHMANCNRLYIIYSGSGWYRDGGAERPFLPQTLYLFPMKAEFRVHHLSKEPLDHMYFDFSLTPPLRSSRISAISLTGPVKDRHFSALRQLVRSLEALLTVQDPGDRETVEVLFQGLLQLVCQVDGHSLSRDIRVESALERIHAVEPDGTLCLPDNQELADMLHLEVNHFIRLFKREVGVTPYQYILSHRLNVASACIADGGSVTEAAHLVGYESVAALSHAMHRRAQKIK